MRERVRGRGGGPAGFLVGVGFGEDGEGRLLLIG